MLIVEDEALVAMLLEDMLTDAGCAVAQCIGSPASGAGLYRESSADDFDFAILDVNLGGDPSFPIAEALRAKGQALRVRHRLWAGRPAADSWRDRPTLSKPFGAADVARVLAEA